MIEALQLLIFVVLARACFKLGYRAGFNAGVDGASHLWPQPENSEQRR